MFDRRRDLPLLRMAWRNARRHTRRTLLTGSAVAVAVAAMIFGLAYVGGILDNMLDTYARTETGHVRVRKAGYSQREQFLPVHLNLPDLPALLNVIRAHPGVVAALPRIRTSVLIDGAGSNRPALFVGIDMEGERGYLNPDAMRSTGRLPRVGHAEVMLGSGLTDKLGLSVGDSVTVLGQTAYRSLGGLRLEVSGLATSGVAGIDNSMMFAPLDQAQLLVDLPQGATEIVVFSDDLTEADSLATQLQRALDPMVRGGVESLSWRAQGPLVRTLQTSRASFNIMLMVLLVMAGLIIVNTMLMTVMERTQEFGVQAALGMRNGDIVMSVVLEGLVIGLVGASAGGIVGSAVAIVVGSTGIDFSAAAQGVEMPMQGIIYPDWNALQAIASVTLGTLAAGLATLYPARRAVRLTPAEALRG